MNEPTCEQTLVDLWHIVDPDRVHREAGRSLTELIVFLHNRRESELQAEAECVQIARRIDSSCATTYQPGKALAAVKWLQNSLRDWARYEAKEGSWQYEQIVEYLRSWASAPDPVNPTTMPTLPESTRTTRVHPQTTAVLDPEFAKQGASYWKPEPSAPGRIIPMEATQGVDTPAATASADELHVVCSVSGWSEDPFWGNQYSWQRNGRCVQVRKDKHSHWWASLRFTQTNVGFESAERALEVLASAFPVGSPSKGIIESALTEWPAFEASLRTVAVDPGKGSDETVEVRVVNVHRTPDQTHKADAGKPSLLPLLTMPIKALAAVAAVRAHGIQKYGPDFRNVARERWLDAILRHLHAAMMEPGSKDAESGQDHLAHVAVSAILAMAVK